MNDELYQVRKHLERQTDSIKENWANGTAVEDLMSAAKLSAYADVMRFIRTISKENQLK